MRVIIRRITTVPSSGSCHARAQRSHVVGPMHRQPNLLPATRFLPKFSVVFHGKGRWSSRCVAVSSPRRHSPRSRHRRAQLPKPSFSSFLSFPTDVELLSAGQRLQSSQDPHHTTRSSPSPDAAPGRRAARPQSAATSHISPVALSFPSSSPHSRSAGISGPEFIQ
jgi:hypothetical protein